MFKSAITSIISIICIIFVYTLYFLFNVVNLRHDNYVISRHGNLGHDNYVIPAIDSSCHGILSRWLDSEGIVTEFSSKYEIRRQAAFRLFRYIGEKSDISQTDLLSYSVCRLLELYYRHNVSITSQSSRNDTVFHVTTISPSSLVP